ncbi:hypothetical protein [Aureibacter tunicatorum]|uniref:Uncharacterized protein n=1 Tax=Aureibacter tunicatorum TaxID=866807 RepID=A0AAE3XMI6_9BACT|nr:hypothetical protein [Aureibacter tunicatorum]MDR6238718.1 hypothetical protein [Aureibacter tunicatorum]
MPLEFVLSGPIQIEDVTAGISMPNGDIMNMNSMLGFEGVMDEIESNLVYFTPDGEFYGNGFAGSWNYNQNDKTLTLTPHEMNMSKNFQNMQLGSIFKTGMPRTLDLIEQNNEYINFKMKMDYANSNIAQDMMPMNAKLTFRKYKTIK